MSEKAIYPLRAELCRHLHKRAVNHDDWAAASLFLQYFGNTATDPEPTGTGNRLEFALSAQTAELEAQLALAAQQQAEAKARVARPSLQTFRTVLNAARARAGQQPPYEKDLPAALTEVEAWLFRSEGQ